jgi:LacI family transcriptional regulator
MSQATLKDVAVRAGVSHQTVSNVLNDHPHIRPATRDRVLAAIKALDYHPNLAAKALREARITALCCAFYGHDAAQIGDPYRNLIQSAFVAEADVHGYSMGTAFLRRDQPESFGTLRQRYRQKLVGGAVVTANNMSWDQWQDIQDWGMDCVLFDHRFAGHEVNTVCADYRMGMDQLVSHHVSRGRRDLALIIPLTDPGSTATERREQFSASVARLGVRGRLVEGDWSFEGGVRAAQALLNPAPGSPDGRPDAILAGNDRMAAGALRAAQDLGLNVSGSHLPGDVAVSGFDDFEFALYTNPTLTTVHVPHGEMARTAVLNLLRLIEQGEDQPLVCFDTTLIVRDSA